MFAVNSIHGQATPVSWSFNITKTDDGDRKLVATATIADGWHLYSQQTDSDGPVPTSFTYSGIDPVGKTIELTEAKTVYSELFEMNVSKFSKNAVFEQSFKKKAGAKSGQVIVNFMCCDNEKCLPPSDVVFDFRP